MSFLHPILFGLGAAFVALPIVLHFLRRRRPPVEWGAMRFLLEAYRSQRRRMTLERLLLLASRCLLVLLVAALIGRPIFGRERAADGPRDVYLLLDNSIASTLETDGRTTLERSKAAALSVLDDLDTLRGDRAALILLGGPAEASVLPVSSDLAAVGRAVERAEATASRADIAGGFERIERAVGDDTGPVGARATAIVLGGFRSGSVPIESPLAAIGDAVGAVIVSEPNASPARNTAVVALDPLRHVVLGEGQVGGQATVTLERSGALPENAERVQIVLRSSSGVEAGRAESVFRPGDRRIQAVVPFVIAADGADGPEVLTAAIEADALPADNAAAVPLDRRSSLRVGIVAPRSRTGGTAVGRFSPADWVRLALSPNADEREIDLVEFTPGGLDAPSLSMLDAALLLDPGGLAPDAWGDLRAFADRGGLVVVFPSTRPGVQTWTDAFISAFGLPWSIDREPAEPEAAAVAPEGRDADDRLLAVVASELPDLLDGIGVARLLRATETGGPAVIAVRADTGDPLIVSSPPMINGVPTGAGLVVFVSAAPDPEWTDLPTRAAMVPVMQELVRQGVGLARPAMAATAGRSTGALGGGADALLTMEGEPAALPVRQAGVFRWLDDRGLERGLVAVNPDSAGSRIDTIDRDRVGAWFSDALPEDAELRWLGAGGRIENARDGADRSLRDESGAAWWIRWLAIAAIAVAVLETLVARLASRGAGAPIVRHEEEA